MTWYLWHLEIKVKSLKKLKVIVQKAYIFIK